MTRRKPKQESSGLLLNSKVRRASWYVSMVSWSLCYYSVYIFFGSSHLATLSCISCILLSTKIFSCQKLNDYRKNNLPLVLFARRNSLLCLWRIIVASQYQLVVILKRSRNGFRRTYKASGWHSSYLKYLANWLLFAELRLRESGPVTASSPLNGAQCESAVVLPHRPGIYDKPVHVDW